MDVSLIDQIRDYIETLTPQPLVLREIRRPYYIDIFNEYTIIRAFKIEEILKDLHHLFIDTDNNDIPNILTDRDSNRSSLVLGSVLFMNYTKLLVSIRRRSENITGLWFSDVEDDFISNIIVEASSPDLNISLSQTGNLSEGIWIHTKWRCEHRDDRYIYHPVDDLGEDILKFPYMVPLRKIRFTPGYSRLQIKVTDADGRVPGPYTVEIMRHWIGNKYRKFYFESDIGILVPISSTHYLFCNHMLWNAMYHYNDWKATDEDYQIAVGRTIKKKLTFITGTHQRDTSSLKSHFRGCLGEPKVLKIIFSFLPEIDVPFDSKVCRLSRLKERHRQ
jgi:hypothetical protein